MAADLPLMYESAVRNRFGLGHGHNMGSVQEIERHLNGYWAWERQGIKVSFVYRLSLFLLIGMCLLYC